MAERFRNGRVGSVSQCPGPGVHKDPTEGSGATNATPPPPPPLSLSLLAYRRIDPEGTTVARDDPPGQVGNAGAMDALGAGIFAARLKPQPLVLDVLLPLEQIACDGNRAAFVQVALCYQHRHAGQRVARCGLHFDVIRQSLDERYSPSHSTAASVLNSSACLTHLTLNLQDGNGALVARDKVLKTKFITLQTSGVFPKTPRRPHR
uniref:Uncharacterized protein n=1 Tax=Anopheles coluzzii TaxID=1518534 RepID=A0A8W7PEL9_ANOCL